jgi:hypothetical protein
VVSKGENCCNTASESGRDLRGQQFAKTSPIDYLSKGPATTPPDLGKMTVSQTVLAGRPGDPGVASAQLARRRLRAEGAEAAPLQG